MTSHAETTQDAVKGTSVQETSYVDYGQRLLQMAQDARDAVNTLQGIIGNVCFFAHESPRRETWWIPEIRDITQDANPGSIAVREVENTYEAARIAWQGMKGGAYNRFDEDMGVDPVEEAGRILDETKSAIRCIEVLPACRQ